MNVEQLLDSKSKHEVAFMMFEDDLKLNCLQCPFLQEDEYRVWNCKSINHREVCEKEWENFLQHIVNNNRFHWSEWEHQ